MTANVCGWRLKVTENTQGQGGDYTHNYTHDTFRRLSITFTFLILLRGKKSFKFPYMLEKHNI